MNLKYGVFVLKRDQEHIQVLETEEFKKADELWLKLHQQWTECLHEQRPFILREPVITAFDPGLIYEVTVRPVTEATKDPDNPYQRKMHKEGFSAAFRGDVLDGGYRG